jgi:hypothetical protein
MKMVKKNHDCLQTAVWDFAADGKCIRSVTSGISAGQWASWVPNHHSIIAYDEKKQIAASAPCSIVIGFAHRLGFNRRSGGGNGRIHEFTPIRGRECQYQWSAFLPGMAAATPYGTGIDSAGECR